MWVFWLILIGFVVLFVWKLLRDSRIVECPNCHNKMTYRRFKQNGGCVTCGSDLYIKTGKRVF